MRKRPDLGKITMTMKNNERMILLLLSKNEGSLTKIKIVKLLFLFCKESSGNIYDFLPYKYGPFSFQLYRDLSKLSQRDWIDDNLFRVTDSKKEEALDEIRKLPRSFRDNFSDIYRTYGKLSESELLKNVYSKYPEFTFRSELPIGNHSSSTAPISIYTIGYEGVSIDSFLNNLLQHGIKKIIDVRSNPVSRKWGFAKNTLAGLCEKVDISYLHLPELGIPPDKRRGLITASDIQGLLDDYEKNYLPACSDKLSSVLSLIEQTPSALVCMEADVQTCHRGRLAKSLAELSTLPTVHLSVK